MPLQLPNLGDSGNDNEFVEGTGSDEYTVSVSSMHSFYKNVPALFEEDKDDPESVDYKNTWGPENGDPTFSPFTSGGVTGPYVDITLPSAQRISNVTLRRYFFTGVADRKENVTNGDMLPTKLWVLGTNDTDGNARWTPLTDEPQNIRPQGWTVEYTNHMQGENTWKPRVAEANQTDDFDTFYLKHKDDGWITLNSDNNGVDLVSQAAPARLKFVLREHTNGRPYLTVRDVVADRFKNEDVPFLYMSATDGSVIVKNGGEDNNFNLSGHMGLPYLDIKGSGTERSVNLGESGDVRRLIDTDRLLEGMKVDMQQKLFDEDYPNLELTYFSGGGAAGGLFGRRINTTFFRKAVAIYWSIESYIKKTLDGDWEELFVVSRRISLWNHSGGPDNWKNYIIDTISQRFEDEPMGVSVSSNNQHEHKIWQVVPGDESATHVHHNFSFSINVSSSTAYKRYRIVFPEGEQNWHIHRLQLKFGSGGSSTGPTGGDDCDSSDSDCSTDGEKTGTEKTDTQTTTTNTAAACESELQTKNWGDLSMACIETCNFGQTPYGNLSNACKKHYPRYLFEEYKLWILGAVGVFVLLIVFLMLRPAGTTVAI